MRTNYYKMLPEHKFAIVRLQSETFSFQEAEQINFEYKSDTYYSNIHYLLIIVGENCRPNFSIKDLEKLSVLYNTEFQQNNHKSIVWLVAEPIVTAFAQLFVSKTKDNSLYCSTLDKAHKLLGIPIDFDKFKNLIKTSTTEPI
jgi:hypothetical protein